MPKKKSRKPTRHSRPPLEEMEDSHTQNPKMAEEKVEEEDSGTNLEQNYQNPEIIEEDNNTNEDEDLHIQNPKTIVDLESFSENTNSILGTSQNLSPKVIVEEHPQQSETLEGIQDLHNEDHHQREEQEKKHELEEPEGRVTSPSLSHPPIYDIPMLDSEIPDSPKGDQSPDRILQSPMLPQTTAQDLALENPPTAPKRGPHRKKTMNKKQRANLEKKLELIKRILKPIPFIPTKTLDFSKHEKLFKSLGLWDFAHIQFDHEIRLDLLASLIANYNPTIRGSSVNDYKIMVNRADLGRALKLPMRKDRSYQSEALDDNEVLSDESISFVEEFVSNWILLHEDMWILPTEVLTWNKYIREGQPQKVDWPSMIWFMVEKELLQGTQLGSCYYASHLQYLIKFQRIDLFREEPKVEGPSEDGEDTVYTKVKSMEEFQGNELANEHVELTLGQERNEIEQQVREEDVMDFEECKEPGDPPQWLLDGRNSIDDHCLRRCNLNKIESLEDHVDVKEEEEDQEQEEEEEEEETEEERFNLSSKFATMERLAPTDILQAMGPASIPYTPSIQLVDNSTGEFLHTRSNNNVNHMNLGGPSMSCKREYSNEDNILNYQNKRMRNNGPWDPKVSNLDMCFEQMYSVMGKAKMICAEKENEIMNAHVNQEILMTRLQERENYIHNLQKEVQKRDMGIYKRDHELRIMSNLLEGYRNALKETRRVFTEYRKRCPEPDEPLYKDVPGTGGIVLSVMALEKQRLEREEEARMHLRLIEQNIEEFQFVWSQKLEVSIQKSHVICERLLKLNEEVKLLKEISAKPNMSKSETQACIFKEEEEV